MYAIYPRDEDVAMSETTESFAETTGMDFVPGVIDEALRSLRISGSLLLTESYVSPWGVAIPQAQKLADLLKVEKGVRVVAFHLVEFGHCEITVDGGSTLLLKAGELAICFGGEAHRLSQGKPRQVQTVEALLGGQPNRQAVTAEGQVPGASLLCGVFLLHNTFLNPLFAALPPFMQASLSRPGQLNNLSGVAMLMAEEILRKSPGGGYIVERLLEVLCAEAIRAHLEAATSMSTSWFRAIKDPVVGRAIAAIHNSPGETWTVGSLADRVAMSASRFAARFTQLCGDTPMAYVAKWRMNLACRQLEEARLNLDRIAEQVGYESPAAFSRAFKKYVGQSPAQWRAKRVGELATRPG